ncbi:reverse transcriptase domain-containing protein [Tanacetum coccineum]
MAEGDEDKMAFFAGEGVLCDRKMPFGLKNAGATYQRLVDKVFHDQIGRNLEAYVDDMVIKSMSEEEMLADIKETFEKFLSINMKLNPKKCSFGVEEVPFLGHLITKQGIRANPSKEKAITDVEQPKTLTDIQSLNGKIAALSRFLLKGAERSLPFFKGAELNYLGLEKLILVLVHTARRLRRYFQAHTLTVLTNSPIRQTLTKPKKSGRVAKWAIELGEHDTAFQKRGDETPKDFLTEVPPGDNNKEIEDMPNIKLKKTELSCEWNLYTDGAASSDGSGA